MRREDAEGRGRSSADAARDMEAPLVGKKRERWFSLYGSGGNHVRERLSRTSVLSSRLRCMPPTAGKRSEALELLLATASGLFYAEGISKVGVDRIVSASYVTLATFYRHFPGKQDLVVPYLHQAHASEAQRMAELAEGAQGRELVRAIGRDIVGMIGSPNFRGCAFINAGAEFEDPEDPVRRV